MQLSILFGSLLLSGFTSAHFQLQYPPSLGFDEDIEPNGPCGGFDIKFADNDTQVPVNGFPVALTSEHPQGDFSYRATISKSDPYTWYELLGVNEKGLGSFCLPNLKVPSNWTGSNGVIQVIGNLGDGTLYQCATVKFVAGSTTSIDSSVCKNSSVTATVTSNGNVTGTSANTTSPSGSTSASSSPSPSSTGNAATKNLVNGAFVAGLGALIVGLGGGI